jgi:3-oxoacyl-[acyl-carrier protein] reductase
MQAQPAQEGPRVYWVAGGVRGLGLGVARALASRGETVYVTWNTSADRARALESEFPGRVLALDAQATASVDAVAATIRAREGRLDGLINAIGAYTSRSLEQTDAAQIDSLWRSNVMTSMHLVEATRAALRATRGAYLFFGCAGLEGLRARRECAAYASTKSALLVLMRSLAVEEAPFGVRANMISPGIVPHDGAHPETLDARLHARIPMGQPGTTADIAAAALFLMDAQHTTGADLVVAGGWML